MPPEPDHSATPNDLHARVVALMKRLGLTRREDLASRMGYSRTSLYTYETGQDTPSDRFLMALEALENRAQELTASTVGSFSQLVSEDPPENDSFARLLRGMDFPALCSVIESAAAQLRSATRYVPEAAQHIQAALNEIRQRSPSGRILRYPMLSPEPLPTPHLPPQQLPPSPPFP